MGGEKKRKRPESGGRRQREEVDMGVQQPTEDEVEEFFAILRRMRVAARYFENNNINNDVKLAGKTVPAALETVVEATQAGKVVTLDLNSVPDGEINISSD